MDILTVFFLLGGILLIGYFGEIVSKSFGVPSALLLLVLGFSLQYAGIVDVELLSSFQILFGTLALIILLFDGGLSLKVEELVFKSGSAFFMAVISTVLGILGSILVLHSLFGFDPIVAAIMGAIAGGIGSSTTISIMSSLNMPQRIKDFLTLESSISDVFSIVLAIVLSQALMSGSLDIQKIGQGVLSTFAVGAFIGLACALLYVGLLYRVYSGYNYMVTFGVLLIVYALTELMNGSGAIAALIVGIILGNKEEIAKAFRLHISTTPVALKDFQSEISFFVRTFFFVYLGIIVSVGSIYNFLIALAFMVMMYLVRYVSLRVTARNTELNQHQLVLTAVNPRGLATAVLATLPLAIFSQNGTTVPLEILGQLNVFPEIAFDIIIISIVMSSFLVPFALKRDAEKKEHVPEEKPNKTQVADASTTDEMHDDI